MRQHSTNLGTNHQPNYLVRAPARGVRPRGGSKIEGVRNTSTPVIEQMGPENVDEVARLHMRQHHRRVDLAGAACRARLLHRLHTHANRRGPRGARAGRGSRLRAGLDASGADERHVLRNNRWHLLVAMLFGIVTRPRSLALLLKRSRGPEEGDHDPGVPQLIYLAVDAASRRLGRRCRPREGLHPGSARCGRVLLRAERGR